MSLLTPTIAAAFLSSAILYLRARWRVAAQAEYIRSYTLPVGLYDKLRHKRPDLTLKECQLVGHALRQFFLAYLKSGRKFVSMPSQVTDELWHEFILYTKHYDAFCKKAFGQFMHHSPAATLGSNRQSNTGLRRVWWFACKEENINPLKATRLPLLFALDAKLSITDGFRYAVDCTSLRRMTDEGANSTIVYCGGDFTDSSFDGTTDGFADATSSDTGGGHGDGCSSGCGGGGCGGD